MKKTILSLALLAGVAGAANAQTGIKYGLKGGFNGATYAGADSKGVEYKAGFAAGGFLNFGLSDNFSIQPELLYSQKGASRDNVSYQSGSSTLNGTQKITLGYLDVPIMFRFNLGEEGKGFFVEAGPQGSFALHQRAFIEDGSGNKVGDTFKSTDSLNKVGIGYVGGIGYQITSGLGIGVRYTGDLSHVYKQDLNLASANVRNSVFQFQVGYAFGGK